ncbi:MAG: hypothetical protein IPP79_15760 [Chitinophagaceae bacterium]|nr:hypothetical protein [Chitinophagaceae bacterium]
MRLFLSILLTSLFLIPSVRGNGDFNVLATVPLEKTQYAESNTQANFTSFSSSSASFLHINSSNSARTIFPSRFNAHIPVELVETPNIGLSTFRKAIVTLSPHTHYKRIGLRLLFPKHYFW